jgi:hypothetical protein
MITLHNVVQRSPEWFKLREGRWTGSTAILLLAERPLPPRGPKIQTTAMFRGEMLEPIAIAEYQEQTGIDVFTTGFVTNSDYPNAGYSPDGIVGDTLLEVKCLGKSNHEALCARKIPMEYMAQVQFGLLICELDKAQIIAFNPDHENPALRLVIIDVPRDEQIITNIRNKLQAETAATNKKILHI